MISLLISLKVFLLSIFFPAKFKENDKINFYLGKSKTPGIILNKDTFSGVYRIRWVELKRISNQTIYYIDKNSKKAY